MVNKEEGQKGLDASRRRGDGAFGLHGYRVGCVKRRSGLERLLGRAGVDAGSRSSSASSASAAAAAAAGLRIAGVLENWKLRVGEVRTLGTVGAVGVVGAAGTGTGGERGAEREAFVWMERAAETLGAKLR